MWQRYMAKYGSLAVVRRIEQSAGNLCAVTVAANGGKDPKPEDFMPHEDRGHVTLEQAMEEWQ